MAKIPAVTVKHSSKMKESDLAASNKRQAKLRECWMNMGQSQEEVNRTFPVETLDRYTAEPGFYAKFGGSRGGTWYGPYDDENYALDAVGEIAYEVTHG